MERHLAIVAARSGSKSIKDKNLIQLGGKTLIKLALEKAYDSGIFNKVILTTDYSRHVCGIDDLKNPRSCQFEFHKRPSDLCGDDTEMMEVIQHVLRDTSGDFKWVWLLQPTSPFRCKADFINIHRALSTGKYNSAISFAPAKDHPNRCYSIKDNIAWPLAHVNFKNKQDLLNVYTRSGNYYVAKYEDLIKPKATFQNTPFYCFYMGNITPDKATKEEKEYSRVIGMNIDDRFDKILCNYFVNTGEVKL